jgi:hypothetical protein
MLRFPLPTLSLLEERARILDLIMITVERGTNVFIAIPKDNTTNLEPDYQKKKPNRIKPKRP